MPGLSQRVKKTSEYREVLGLYRKRPGDIRLGCNASGGPGRF